MKIEPWHGEIIREIDLEVEYIEVALLDNTGNKLLYFEIRGGDFVCKFNVDWIDDKRIDWIASVFGRILYESYMQGLIDKQKEIKEQLSGLKSLLK